MLTPHHLTPQACAPCPTTGLLGRYPHRSGAPALRRHTLPRVLLHLARLAALARRAGLGAGRGSGRGPRPRLGCQRPHLGPERFRAEGPCLKAWRRHVTCGMCVCVCASTPVSKGTNLSIFFSFASHLYSSRGMPGISMVGIQRRHHGFPVI